MWRTSAIFAPRSEPSQHISFVSFLVLSAVHNIPWLLLLLYILGRRARSWDRTVNFVLDHPGWFVLFGVVALVVSPIVVAFAWERIKWSSRFRRLARRLGAKLVNPYPTAWIQRFVEASTDGDKWLVVHLDGGSKIYGYYGKRSYASISKDSHDLYLEELYIFRNNTWTPVSSPNRQRTPGILIPGNKIVAIEVWPGSDQ